MNFGAQRDLKLSARLQNERKEVKTIIKGAKTIAWIGIKTRLGIKISTNPERRQS